MSWINLGELFYVMVRRTSVDEANALVDDLRAKVALDVATPARVLQAATIKADHAMSYADAFAVATAQAHGAVLLTGDPEILDARGPWETEDLR